MPAKSLCNTEVLHRPFAGTGVNFDLGEEIPFSPFPAHNFSAKCAGDALQSFNVYNLCFSVTRFSSEGHF